MVRARKPGGGDGDSGGGKKGGHGGGVPSNTAEAQERAEAEVDLLAVRGATGPERQIHRAPKGPAANHSLLPPSKERHDLNRIKTKAFVKEKNSVVQPDVDMEADFEAIQRGEARWNPGADEYEINGRTYGIKTNKAGDLMLFPTGGVGVHNLDRFEYKILQSMIMNGGDTDAAWEQNRRNPNVTPERWDAALEAFSHHKSYKG